MADSSPPTTTTASTLPSSCLRLSCLCAMVARIAGALEIEPFQLLYDDDSGLSRSIWERYLEGVEGRLIASVSSVIKSSFNEMKSTSGVPMPGIGIPGIEIPVSDGSNIKEN